ncbi:MAG: hypothetical protein DCC75_08860 [Proteobacteria bacterium]|nr:MAG: hypothetical protein DCC75_08860 [Pseudomonadota bacterium]
MVSGAVINHDMEVDFDEYSSDEKRVEENVGRTRSGTGEPRRNSNAHPSSTERSSKVGFQPSEKNGTRCTQKGGVR